MPLEGLTFVKMLAIFGIICLSDPLLQNMTKIICLCLLSFLSINLCRPCGIVCGIFQNQGSFPHSISQMKLVTPFFASLTQVTQYLTAVKI